MYPLTLSPISPITQEPHQDGTTLLIPATGGEMELRSLQRLNAGQYLVLDTTAHADTHVPIELRFYAQGEESPRMRYTTSSIPGVRAVMPMALSWLDNTSVFKPRTPGRMKTTAFGVAVEPGDVSAIRLFFRPFYRDIRITFHSVYVCDAMPDTGLKAPVPVVDALGQVATRTWPGKTADETALSTRLRALYDEAEAWYERGMPYDKRFGYSAWGGDSSNRLTQGSGYFAVHKQGECFYLVDPEGYAFFSVGPDCVGTNTTSLLDGIEPLYAELPDRTAFADVYEQAVSSVSGVCDHFINFEKANLIRVFGAQWFKAYCLITEYLIKRMGFNTIGNWSDSAFIEHSRLPYVLPLKDFPTTEALIYRDFPDVFSEEYALNSETFARQMEALAGDPRLIGYFMRNEPQWGFSEDINLALEMFRSGTRFESKKALYIALLEQYGNADALSDAWGIDARSALEFYALTLEELEGNARRAADLMAFSKTMVNRYVTLPAKALRAVAPHHLNLGMRYAFISSDAMFEGSEWIDVFSINCYRPKPKADDVDNILTRCGKPCMIGEYHYGAIDRGCFGNALRAVATQRERGIAYSYFTEQAAAMPSMLGCHYFSWGDEAALGRADGECWQFGILDACLKPYAEFVDAAITTHERLYRVKSGACAPCDTPAVEIPSDSY